MKLLILMDILVCFLADVLTIAKRVFSNKSELERSVSPVKKGVGVLPRGKGKLQSGRGVRSVTRGASVSSKRGKR
jgi:hypothetical protein